MRHREDPGGLEICSLDWIRVNILVMMFYSSSVRCYHGSVLFTIRIGNCLKIKELIKNISSLPAGLKCNEGINV